MFAAVVNVEGASESMTVVLLTSDSESLSGTAAGKSRDMRLKSEQPCLNETNVSLCVFDRMEGQSRSCHRYLLLQVWCGFLTVSVVFLFALFVSNKSKSVEVSIREHVAFSCVPPNLVMFSTF